MSPIRRDRRGVDHGFTIIEVIIAMVLVLIVMTAVLSVLVSSLTTVTQARQRQTATALATQTLERLRALAYDEITVPDASFPASGGLEYVTGTPAMFAPGPVLPGVASELLIVNERSAKRSVETIDDVTFTVQTYVTQPAATAAGQQAFNITALVSWTSSVYADQRTVAERSVVYSPSGCLSTAHRPFAAPCQAYFTAQAGQTSASFAVVNPDDATQMIIGFDGDRIELDLASLSTNFAMEQTANGAASAATSQVRTPTAAFGGVSAGATVDSDPSSAPLQREQEGTSTQVDAPVQLNAAFGRIVAQSTSTDDGLATSAIAADSLDCRDGTASASGLATGPSGALRPCSSAEVQQLGTDASIEYHDNGSAVVSLVTQEPSPGASRAVAANLASPIAGTACAAATALTGTGCSHAAAYRALGTITVAVPAGSTSSTGAPDGLWTLDGLTESALAESGSGAAAPAYTRSGTLKLWNGTGYTIKSLADFQSPADGTSETWTWAAPSAPVATPADLPAVTREYPGGISVTVSGSITLSRPTASSTGTATCKPDACTAQTDGSGTLRAQTLYVVSQGAVEITRFVVVTDLGGLVAKSSFKAVPDA